MTRKLTPLIFLLTLLASAAVCWFPTRGRASSQPATQASPLTPQERRGRTIYQRGESPSGKEILARLGDISIPASSLACASCHGLRGAGLTEGGVSAGPLTWSELTRPAGHTHQNGRKHKAFDDRSLAQATIECVDPSGNKLLTSMPCYQLAPEDMADLLAYLKRLQTTAEPGVTNDTIVIASLISTEGQLAPTGAAMRAVLTAYFQELNSQGGINQRRVELRFIDMANSPTATITNLKSVMETDQAFAMVGGVVAGVDQEAFGLAQSQELPVVGPSTLLPVESPNRYVFYFSPGVKDQMRALVNFAAGKPEVRKSGLLIVYPEGLIAREAAAAVEAQAKKLKWENVEKRPFAAGGFAAATLVEDLKAEQSNALFFLGSGEQTRALLKEAALVNWTPNVFLPLSSIRDAASVPSEFKNKVFVGFPSIPADISATAAAEFRSLREKYKLPEDHVAPQLAALAAAKVFVAAATKVGRELSRERLVNTLETFSDFETGLTHRLTFGPGRRVGARGAYVVTIDVEKGTFSPTGWVEAN